MQAILLAGHGSLRRGSGAAMLRLAARLRERAVAPLAAAGFLNYSRPTLAAALDRLVEQGAHEVAVVPYFLVPGHFARVSLPQALQALHERHPTIHIRLADCLGDHPALAQLALLRASETQVAAPPERTGLLLMAHGSPDPQTSATIESLAAQVGASAEYAAVRACYLDLNEPLIPATIDALVATGLRQLVAVPLFLQLGGHVAADLPALVSEARQRHPALSIALAAHLGYHPLLAQAIAERALSTLPGSVPRATLRAS